MEEIIQQTDQINSGSRSAMNATVASSIINSIGSLLSGGATLTQAITGNYPDTYYVSGYNEANEQTTKYLIIGGIALVAIVVLVVVLAKK